MALPRVYAGRRRRLFARLLLNGLVQAAVMIATVTLLRELFDGIAGTGQAASTRESLALSAAALVLLALLGGWLRAVERVDAEDLGQRYAQRLRLQMFAKLARLSPRSIAARGRGGLVLRFVSDLDALRRWLSLGFARLLVAGCLVVLTLAALAIESWQLGLLVSLALASGVAISLTLGRPLDSAIRESRRRRSRIAGNITEKTAAMVVVQAHGQSTRERRRLRRQSRQLRRAMLERARLLGMMRGVSDATARIGIAVAVVAGSWGAAAGWLTPGSVIAAVSVVAFLGTPIRDLSRVYGYWCAARVSREKIAGFLSAPELPVASAPRRLRRGPGELRFHRVQAPGLKAPISARAAPGGITAICGPNGAGKSTLLWLAARLITPTSGRISLDGRELAELRTSELRSAVSIVSPDVTLLRGSVGRNLRYRQSGAPDSELERVCRLCRVDDLLAALPDGVQTRLTEGGGNLSQGERQRVALARALLGAPRLLILDEFDAVLDPESGAAIDAVLREFAGSVVLVTHDLQRFVAADQAWYIADGHLVAAGEPAALLRDQPVVHRFFHPQPTVSVA